MCSKWGGDIKRGMSSSADGGVTRNDRCQHDGVGRCV